MCLKHFSHDHFLYSGQTSYVLDISRRKCDMCNNLLGNHSEIYICREFDGYVIHKRCGDLPQHINDHQLHIPHHRLTLVIRNYTNNNSISTNCCCYYCDLPFQKDDFPYYKCDHCHDFYIHPKCANIALPTIATSVPSDEKDHELVRFLCHKEPMALLPAEKHKGEKCFACQSLCSGFPTYSCVSKTCNNFFHKSCVDKLTRRIQHPFHSQHPLTLQVSKPSSCDSCWEKDCRLVFSCVEDRCDNSMKLCTKCVFLEKHINCQWHDHFLSLVEINFASPNARAIRCDACQKNYHKKCSEVNATQSYLFRCMECNFNLHFLCGPLPISLKYEYHIHPLALVHHSVTKNDSDEYYCDICEEERDSECRLYYCASCKFNAHIHCLLQEIMKVIKGNTENVELCALGEDRWRVFHIDSMDHHTREITNASSHGIKKLTLRDLMDSLSEKEKKSLNTTTRASLILENDEFVKLFGPLNFRVPDMDREGSIEDIDWIRKLFRFGLLDLYSLTKEILFFKNLEGLKVDEKYLRQEINDVDGYMVPKTLAPILRTLLGRHGNLNGNPNLTSTMKSVAATILCGVIDKMCIANIEDVTLDVLKQWCHDLYGVTNISGFREVIEQSSFRRLLIYKFPGLKAIRIKKEVSEILQIKIAKLEAELKMCKEKQLKLEEFESEASDFMKQSMREAAKWQGKKVADLWFPIPY